MKKYKNIYLLRFMIVIVLVFLCAPCAMTETNKKTKRTKNKNGNLNIEKLEQFKKQGNNSNNSNTNQTKKGNTSSTISPYLEISDYNDKQLSFTASGGNENYKKVSVSNNLKNNFSITSSEYWCNVTKHKNQLTIYCNKNTSPHSRSAKITISAKGAENEYIYVTQYGIDYSLKIRDKSYSGEIEIPEKAKQYRIPVETNDIISSCEILNSYPENWAKVYKDYSGSCYFECDTNYTGVTRWANVKITTNNNKEDKVKIVQPALKHYAEVKSFNTDASNAENFEMDFNLNVTNMKDMTGRAEIYFYDSNGNPLKSNSSVPDKYNKNGQIYTSKSFQPIYEGANNWPRFKMSIPFKYVANDRKTDTDINYKVSIFDNNGNKLTESPMQSATIPFRPYIEIKNTYNNTITEIELDYEKQQNNYSIITNDGHFSLMNTGDNCFTITPTASGFELRSSQNNTKNYRYGTLTIETDNTKKDIRISQSYKYNRRTSNPIRTRFSLGFDLAASANYNMKNIGSEENSELFYSWGGGMLFRTTFLISHNGEYYDRINLSLGARYMKYSYNYLTTKGDLGNYIVFPINLKFNLNRSDRCQFYIGAGYEYGMGLKDAPTFMDWNAGIGLCGRVVDWYIFYKQHFNTEDAGKFYFSDKYKNHIGTTVTFYINLGAGD